MGNPVLLDTLLDTNQLKMCQPAGLPRDDLYRVGDLCT